MADLSVETADLDVAAASGADIADALSGGVDAGGGGSQPSHTGVTAIRASVAAARREQVARGDEYSAQLKAASAAYRRTDGGLAGNISATI